MVVVNFIIKMVDIIKDNGKIIKWMDMVNYIIKVAKLLIKENGHKISLMG